MRSVRPPLLASLHSDLKQPLIYITASQEKAVTAMDELEFWQPGMNVLNFSEPTTLFYEDASWGGNTRRDRIGVLTALAKYHLPGEKVDGLSPLVITSAKALMTRTMSRRDFLKSIMRVAINTKKQISLLILQLVNVG